MGYEKNIIGLDCGNSSFRIVLGKFDGQKITTTVIDQIPNEMIKIGESFHWDLLKIFSEFKKSLKKALKTVDKIHSIGVCTWGIDFALFDKKGNMLLNPLAYRNVYGEKYLNKLSDDEKGELFYKTGILSDKINSLYMLKAYKEEFSEIYSISDKFLMVPDILTYFLTGKMINEPSELSTSQIMSSDTKEISDFVLEKFDIDKSLFCEIGTHGKTIGKLSKDILDELEIDYDIDVICVPSHDTASAVLAVPALEEDFVFISSGTWSLIGTELSEPIINEEVKNAGLTNEVGAFSKITLLKNSAGMFIIQRIKKEYDLHFDVNSHWDELDELADNFKGDIPFFDVNDIRFFNPINMSKEIWSYLLESKQVEGELDFGGVIKAVHYSMALTYSKTIKDIENITGKTYDKIYIVGGGSKNIKVNEYTALASGKTVVACNKESTVLGNIAAQIDENYDIKEIRKIIMQSGPLKEYKKEQDKDLFEKYTNLIK